MARAQVGRPPRGGVAQLGSETAKRAYVAARLAQRSGTAFMHELGVAINSTALSRTAGPLLWHPPDYAPRGPQPGRAASQSRGSAGSQAAALRDWLVVDTAALGISAGLVTFEFESRRDQRIAYQHLQRVVGVVQLVTLARGDLGQRHRVLAMVLADGETDRRRLRESFGEIADDWAWQEVDLQTVEPAVQTWAYLTRLQAERDDLLT